MPRSSFKSWKLVAANCSHDRTRYVKYFLLLRSSAKPFTPPDFRLHRVRLRFPQWSLAVQSCFHSVIPRPSGRLSVAQQATLDQRLAVTDYTALLIVSKVFCRLEDTWSTTRHILMSCCFSFYYYNSCTLEPQTWWQRRGADRSVPGKPRTIKFDWCDATFVVCGRWTQTFVCVYARC
jgi:hypothetical protein